MRGQLGELRAIREKPVQSRLRSRAEDRRHTVIVNQLLHSKHARFQILKRQQLYLVKDNDAFSDVVEFACPRFLAGKQGFEELNVRGDYNGDVPVLGCQLQLFLQPVSLVIVGLTSAFPIEVGMVFQDVFGTQVAKRLTEYGSVLLDNAGERQHIDHTPQVVDASVIEGKGH